MNTRLQVEHPVTEAGHRRRSGARAARWSRPASRCRGRRRQLDQRGHAIECRVYAEDPAHGFLPQAGRCSLYREPPGPASASTPASRKATTVSVHYDPLLAKVIATAETRERGDRAAVGGAARVPDPRHPHQRPVPDRVLEHPAFRAGDLHTGFLDEHLRALLDAPSRRRRRSPPQRSRDARSRPARADAAPAAIRGRR